MICRPCGANDAACSNARFMAGRTCCPACRHVWAARVANPKLPLWSRVHAYAEAHADVTGRCTLAPEELHHGVDHTMRKEYVSRAIKAGVRMGLLEPGSSARCLVLVRGVMTPEAVVR